MTQPAKIDLPGIYSALDSLANMCALMRHEARISELELANKTLETALKHSADLNETLRAQRDKVLIYADALTPATRTAIHDIYAGKEQT